MSSAGDELVDLLDDAGQVIGRVTRCDMRRRRLPHRCVYRLVFTTRVALFVNQRPATKDVFPSYWDLTVGGVVAAGESFDDAARREGREELGVEIQPLRLFPIRYDGDDTIAFGMVYHVTHDGPFHLQVEELSRGEFVSIEELAALIGRERFCPDGIQVWAEFERLKGAMEKS